MLFGFEKLPVFISMDLVLSIALCPACSIILSV